MKELLERIYKCIETGSKIGYAFSVGESHVYSSMIPIEIRQYDDSFVVDGDCGEEVCVSYMKMVYDEMIDSYSFCTEDSEVSIQFI